MEKIVIQSCCGSEAFVYTLKKPVMSEHITIIEDAGFKVLSHFVKVGVIQASKKNLHFTVTIGQNKVNARCYSKKCKDLWDSLESVLNKIEVK